MLHAIADMQGTLYFFYEVIFRRGTAFLCLSGEGDAPATSWHGTSLFPHTRQSLMTRDRSRICGRGFIQVEQPVPYVRGYEAWVDTCCRPSRPRTVPSSSPRDNMYIRRLYVLWTYEQGSWRLCKAVSGVSIIPAHLHYALLSAFASGNPPWICFMELAANHQHSQTMHITVARCFRISQFTSQGNSVLLSE